MTRLSDLVVLATSCVENSYETVVGDGSLRPFSEFVLSFKPTKYVPAAGALKLTEIVPAVPFVEPWVMPTRVLRPFGGDAIVAERANCEVYETGEITNQLRH